MMMWSRLEGTHLRFTGTGRNTGQLGDQPLVYADAPQEDLLVQELVVVMQQDRRVVHRGKSNSRDANLEAMTEPIRWHITKGLQQIGPFGWFVLTALMKRLSVAAGKISFSRVTFLQITNVFVSDVGYRFWTLSSQSWTHDSAEVERVFKPTLEGKNLSGCHICHKSKWLILKDCFSSCQRLMLVVWFRCAPLRKNEQLKPQMSTFACIKPFIELKVHFNY